jgi:hypothetical protein
MFKLPWGRIEALEKQAAEDRHLFNLRMLEHGLTLITLNKRIEALEALMEDTEKYPRVSKASGPGLK